jgi:hypothetical protein
VIEAKINIKTGASMMARIINPIDNPFWDAAL